MIVGPEEFIASVKEELRRPSFGNIAVVSAGDIVDGKNSGIVIEFVGPGHSGSVDIADIPVIYAFDFIAGAGAVVVFPGDNHDWTRKPNLRLWAAEYMAGYCAFWNVDGYDWLHDELPSIRENHTSDAALRTAAWLCARIAANIAVGSDVKRFPRFYIVESGE
ncbi:MAG: hypothetical protein K2K55_07525 [Duncaniella sp.]|nr:hypothetical protein [Duncaniella sp.]